MMQKHNAQLQRELNEAVAALLRCSAVLRALSEEGDGALTAQLAGLGAGNAANSGNVQALHREIDELLANQASRRQQRRAEALSGGIAEEPQGTGTQGNATGGASSFNIPLTAVGTVRPHVVAGAISCCSPSRPNHPLRTRRRLTPI